jgi:hypothetical protein
MVPTIIRKNQSEEEKKDHELKASSKRVAFKWALK